VYRRKSLSWNIFFRCILSLREVYVFEIYVKSCFFWYPLSLCFWNLRKILLLLIPMKSILWKQIFGPLYSAWPKMFWPTMKRSLAPNTFFIYFRFFWKVGNKPQGYVCPSSNIFFCIINCFLLRNGRLVSWDFIFFKTVMIPAAPQETVGEAGIEPGTAA
jgi:hypothetical protein